jgi:hypothetical protein
MEVKIKEQTSEKLVIEVEVCLKGSMLEMEDEIVEALNKAGNLATGEALRRFDTNGESLRVNGKKHTAKGREKKIPNPVW